MSDKKPEPNERRFSVKIDQAQEGGTYANFFSLLNSQNEFVLDFGLLMPAMATVRIGSRVVLHPQVAKQLALVLLESIRKYETAFGEIKPPKAPQPPDPRIMN
jgi:hypothetical protein